MILQRCCDDPDPFEKNRAMEDARYKYAPGFTILFTYINDNGKFFENVPLALSPWRREPERKKANATADGGMSWQG